MVNSRTKWAYVHGFTTAGTMPDVDGLSVDEIMQAFDSMGESDLFITPWKRSQRAAIRAAIDH
jgi:hypothetical protein